MLSVQGRVFWIIVVGLLLLTRIPAASQYLSIDNVNLAYSLEKFDPRIHQPQPPGYPFFVGLARAVNFVTGNAERTFLFISILVCGLCLPAIAALGREMFNPWVAYGSVLLLLFNPVFWNTGLDGPLRPFLALFSVLVAYCSWQAWSGKSQFVILGAIALGIGSGFRPDLLIYLGPLWLVSIVMGKYPPGFIVRGFVVLGVLVAVWAGILVMAIGGPGEVYRLLMQYLVDQARPESVVLGSGIHEWLRQVNRLVIWNGMAVAVFVWAVPFFLLSKARVGLFSRQMWFIKIWLIPGLLFQAFIHIDAPGHTVFSMPAFCVLGVHVLWSAAQYWKSSEDDAPRLAEMFLLVAVAFNLILFLNFFQLPAATAAPVRGTGSMTNALAFGVFEASIGQGRWLDDTSRVSLAELEKFTTTDRPTVIISQDIYEKNWFMNWRIARYYLPTQDIRVAADLRIPAATFSVRRDHVSEVVSGSPVAIHLPRPSRVLWLLESGGRFEQALAKAIPIVRGQKVAYFDVGPDAGPFRVMDFQFVPEDHPVTADNGVQ